MNGCEREDDRGSAADDLQEMPDGGTMFLAKRFSPCHWLERSQQEGTPFFLVGLAPWAWGDLLLRGGIGEVWGGVV